MINEEYKEMYHNRLLEMIQSGKYIKYDEMLKSFKDQLNKREDLSERQKEVINSMYNSLKIGYRIEMKNRGINKTQEKQEVLI